MGTTHPTASDSPSLTLRVTRAEHYQKAAALALLLGEEGREQAAGLVAAESEGGITLAGLFAALRGDALVGSALGLVQPGRTALLWPPRLTPGEPESTANGLLAAVCDQIASEGVRLAQAALPTTASTDAERFMAQGFTHVADLMYLVCDAASFPSAPPKIPFHLDPCIAGDEAWLARLMRLIEHTYQQTCDCPELNGVRDPADVLEGYRQTGVFAPERWLIATDGSQDVGCLLLADHPAEEQWELVYMGVTPAARGRGLGLVLTRHAQWLTAQTGRLRLVLAVDARNQPALAVYEAAGLEPFDRRRVLLKVF